MSHDMFGLLLVVGTTVLFVLIFRNIFKGV